MIGVPGTAQRLFGALREEGISVILISQGSSEHSICFAIPQVEAERAALAGASCVRRGVERRPDPERRRRSAAAASSPSSATAWPARPASPRRCSRSLGAAGVNVRAIAQGASERNISVVIDERADDQGAAVGACRVLSLPPHDLDRHHRARRGRRRAARSARVADGEADARFPYRPAAARGA